MAYYVQAVVEDILQDAVLRKTISTFRRDITIIGTIGFRGNSYIKEKLKSFNDASNGFPHIIITDLDQYPCVSALMDDWGINFQFNRINRNLLFRIAEKEIEAWILADRQSFANFMGVSVRKIPDDTAIIPDPKQYIFSLARRSQNKEMIDLIPKGTALQGPGYNSILQNFVIEHWDPIKALDHNRSLRKAIERINHFLR